MLEYKFARVEPTTDIAAISGDVLREAKREREEFDWHVFWPAHIAQELNISLDDVVKAIELLDRQGTVVAWLKVECPNEDFEWRGSPRTPVKRCPHCGSTLDEEDPFLSFELPEKKKAKVRH